MSRSLLNPIPDCHAVLCEAGEPFERPLPDLVVDVLAELDAFMHRSDDICLAQGAGPRDPTATPSVTLPSVTAEVWATLRSSPILHSGGAAARSFT